MISWPAGRPVARHYKEGFREIGMRKQRLMGLLVSAMMIMGCAVVPGLGKLVSDTGDPVATGVAGTLTALPSDTQVPSSTVVTAEEAPTSQPAQTAAPDFPPTKEPSRPIPQPTIEVPPPRDISFQRIQETSLGLPLMGRVVTLEHGRWEGAGEAGGILTAYFTEFYAEGDLNGDGARDGAALLADSLGGTGTFVCLM